VGIGKYIKRAFLNQWNLLAFLGSMGFAILSGHPDVGIPLVLAAETAYLGFIGTHPRFRRSVDIQEHKTAREHASVEAVERLLRALPPAQVRRFESLRDRCLGLRQIAEQLRHPDGPTSVSSLDDIQLTDLDRLLWIYLRTLYTRHMLERFLENTSREQIEAEVHHLEERIRRLDKQPDSANANRSRIRQSLEANLETGRARLVNLEKARENHELLQAEIENLETKIQSITEMAINRGDAAAITGEVEQITQGLVRTEQAINDLGFATGADTFDLAVPSILSRELARPAKDGEEGPTSQGRRTDEIQFL